MTIFTIRRLTETEEYKVICRVDGKIDENRCYYTDDLEDARATKKAMEEEYDSQQSIAGH